MDSPTSWFMVGETARLTLAVIFALAAIHAMREWDAFCGIVEDYRIVPRWVAAWAARALPPLELAAAAALLVPSASRLGAVLAFCLMLLFTSAIIVNLARGRVSIDCGCGGATGQTLSAAIVVRNVALALGLIMACLAPPRGTLDATSAIGIMGASLALIFLYFTVNQLIKNSQTLDGMATGSPA